VLWGGARVGRYRCIIYTRHRVASGLHEHARARARVCRSRRPGDVVGFYNTRDRSRRGQRIRRVSDRKQTNVYYYYWGTRIGLKYNNIIIIIISTTTAADAARFGLYDVRIKKISLENIIFLCPTIHEYYTCLL